MVAKDAKLVAESVTSYLDLMFSLSKATANLRCYRGQADAGWDIKPSVMRDLKSDAEHQMLSELVLEAPNEFAGENLMFQKLVKAQHYSLPTRLLDVSLNPLVGLYFACKDEKQKLKDGAVQIFDFSKNRVKFADSDAVSLICNLARLSDEEKDLLVNSFKSTTKWDDSAKKRFREIAPMLRLSQFVRVEKPYFLDIAEPRDLFKYFFVYPYKNNKRLIAQSGAFVAAGLLRYSAPNKSSALKVRAIRVPKNRKMKILDELDAININSRSMFPEIDSASIYIKNKWSIRNS